MARCRPPVEAQGPYDELSHEINGNELTVRVAKDAGRIEKVGSAEGEQASVCTECEDDWGNKCRPGCARVRVIPNKVPPAKKPDEEMFLLRSIRQPLGPEETRNTLEIELRTPRNYEPIITKDAEDEEK